MSMRQVLEGLPVDPGAEERAWAVVRAAYAERERHEVRSRRRWPAAAAVALACAAVAAAVASSPGRAVVDAVRRTIGIEHAAPALFRLPAGGRLLVSGRGGTWVVSPDGSKRRLGSYPRASWSPHGLFVLASGTTQVTALDPANGDVHWSLARPAVAWARWGGTRTDTRVAYLSAGRLRVVAGDGKGDRAVAPAVSVPAAWQPERHVVAYVGRRGVVVYDADARRVLAVHAARGVRELAWSADGRTLAAATAHGVVLWTGTRRLLVRLAPVDSIAYSADGRLAIVHGNAVTVLGTESVRTLFRGPGPLADVAWSPDGRWLVTRLPSADQLVFIGRRGVLAVSNIARQFHGPVSLDGWMAGA
jgi:WD40-like Beta Propeller Repeat